MKNALLLLLLCAVTVFAKKINRLIEGENCRKKLKDLGWKKEIAYIKGVGCFITTDDYFFNMQDSMNEPDQEMNIFLEWHLDMIYQEMNTKFQTPTNGENIDIYVLDTGVTPTHVEFETDQVSFY